MTPQHFSNDFFLLIFVYQNGLKKNYYDTDSIKYTNNFLDKK